MQHHPAELAHSCLQALKSRGIRFIVAPYEADAQMAYLALNGLVDAVLTEDSDLLCYGVPTVSQAGCIGLACAQPLQPVFLFMLFF